MLKSSTIESSTMIIKDSKPQQLRKEPNHSETSTIDEKNKENLVYLLQETKAHYRKVLQVL